MKKSHSKYWDFVQELMLAVGDCEVDNEDHVEFILSLFNNLDPYNPEEELTDKQLMWLQWLWNKYCNDNDQDLEWGD